MLRTRWPALGGGLAGTAARAALAVWICDSAPTDLSSSWRQGRNYDQQTLAAFAAKFFEIVTIHIHNCARALRHDWVHYTLTDESRFIMISYDAYGVHMVAQSVLCFAWIRNLTERKLVEAWWCCPREFEQMAKETCDRHATPELRLGQCLWLERMKDGAQTLSMCGATQNSVYDVT